MNKLTVKGIFNIILSSTSHSVITNKKNMIKHIKMKYKFDLIDYSGFDNNTSLELGVK